MFVLPDIGQLNFPAFFQIFPEFFCPKPKVWGGFGVRRRGLRGVVAFAEKLVPARRIFKDFFRRDSEKSTFRTPNAPSRGGFRLMKVYAHRGSFGPNLSFFH